MTAWLARPSEAPIQPKQLTRVIVTEPDTLWEESNALGGTNQGGSAKSITIRDKTGKKLPTEDYNGFSVNLQSLQRTSQIRVHFNQPGDYRILMQGYPEKSVFHLLPSNPFWYFIAGVGAILLGIPVLAAAVVLAIIGLVMRLA